MSQLKRSHIQSRLTRSRIHNSADHIAAAAVRRVDSQRVTLGNPYRCGYDMANLCGLFRVITGVYTYRDVTGIAKRSLHQMVRLRRRRKHLGAAHEHYAVRLQDNFPGVRQPNRRRGYCRARTTTRQQAARDARAARVPAEGVDGN